jgi:hypothetical protein
MTPVVDDLERELDRLYGLPLAEFTTARNELARRRKSSGDDAGAARVRSLAKPSIAAWVVNQLARRDRDAIQTLLDTGATVVETQSRLVRHGGEAEALREATAAQRQAVSVLVRRARGVLADAGRPASPAMVERIAQTLQAAAVDEDGRRLLESGRLAAELEPAGFGAFPAAPVAGNQRSSGRRDELADRRRAREERRTRRRELQARVRELERAAVVAEREAEEAAKAADDARLNAENARAAASEAAAELAGLE